MATLSLKVNLVKQKTIKTLQVLYYEALYHVAMKQSDTNCPTVLCVVMYYWRVVFFLV